MLNRTKRLVFLVTKAHDGHQGALWFVRPPCERWQNRTNNRNWNKPSRGRRIPGYAVVPISYDRSADLSRQTSDYVEYCCDADAGKARYINTKSNLTIRIRCNRNQFVPEPALNFAVLQFLDTIASLGQIDKVRRVV